MSLPDFSDRVKISRCDIVCSIRLLSAWGAQYGSSVATPLLKFGVQYASSKEFSFLKRSFQFVNRETSDKDFRALYINIRQGGSFSFMFRYITPN